jgi:hypothetical protein
MMRYYHEGKVRLGGSAVTDSGGPQWFCKSCEHEWATGQ